jgi:hypothetical protein
MTGHSKEGSLYGEYKVHKEMSREVGALCPNTLLFKKRYGSTVGNESEDTSTKSGTPFEKLDTGRKAATHGSNGRASGIRAWWASSPSKVLQIWFRNPGA